jgi:hypothetical protein
MVNRFQIIGTTLTVASLAMGVVLSVADTANAQRVVTCESRDHERNSCLIDTRGGVRLYRQLSKASCDGNWGYGRNRVWVRNGCRAEFVTAIRRRLSR